MLICSTFHSFLRIIYIFLFVNKFEIKLFMYKYIVYCSQLTAGSCCIALLKRPASIM